MDEQTQKLQSYIWQQLQSGQSPDEINLQLKAASWPEATIQAAFESVRSSVVPSTHAPANETINAVVVPQANGQRRGRIRIGWQLFKQSMQLLNTNRYLLRYLLMTGVWILALTVVFVILYFVFDKILYQTDAYNSPPSAVGYVFAAIEYILIYFVINFYAAALTVNVLDLFQGIKKDYHEYVAVARSKIGAIFIFSVISATVGMILEYIVERIRVVGWILSYLLGALWSLGTMFVIPLIVASEKPSGVSEIKQSVTFFKQTWGETVTAKVTVNGPLALINLACFAVYFIALFTFGFSLGIFAILILTILYVIVGLVLAVVGSFANSVINIALYYYAVNHNVPPAFNQELLNSVFIPRKKSLLQKH